MQNHSHTKRSSQHWQSLFDDCPEVNIKIENENIEGKIPEELTGTLYRNGPGSRRFSKSFFDGDGMIRALRINGNNDVHYHSRFVHTRKYLKELGSKTPKVRTAGTNLPSGILKNMFRIPADEANTHVFYQNGLLLASEEGGHPWILEPDSLETLGEEHFSGALPKNVAFSAHPHYDNNTKEIYNFGMKPGKTMCFQCYKIDQKQKLTMLAGFSCNKGTFAHDYALSGKWMVFILPPVAGDLKKFILGTASFFDTMKWHESWGTQVVLVPRDGGKAIIFDTDTFSVGHIVNAWDEGDDVVIDLGTVKNMDVLKSVANYRDSDWSEFADGFVSRIRINTRQKTLEKHHICEIPAEFPRIHPKLECQKSKWAYFASNTKAAEGGLFRATMKLNRDTGESDIFDFGEHAVALEPVFIPRKDSQKEDEGWVITYVYQSLSKSTDVAIFNAQSIKDGPVATIHLPVNSGTTFHGTWVNAN